jgi:hypothetical protein
MNGCLLRWGCSPSLRKERMINDFCMYPHDIFCIILCCERKLAYSHKISTGLCKEIKSADHKTIYYFRSLHLIWLLVYLAVYGLWGLDASETYPINIQINSEYLDRFRKSKDGRKLYNNAEKLKGCNLIRNNIKNYYMLKPRRQSETFNQIRHCIGSSAADIKTNVSF